MKNEEKTSRCKENSKMIYYRKNDKHENPEMPFPEDFDILFCGDCGRFKKPKMIFRRIAVIFAVCTAVAGAVLVIRHNAKKAKV